MIASIIVIASTSNVARDRGQLHYNAMIGRAVWRNKIARVAHLQWWHRGDRYSSELGKIYVWKEKGNETQSYRGRRWMADDMESVVMRQSTDEIHTAVSMLGKLYWSVSDCTTNEPTKKDKRHINTANKNSDIPWCHYFGSCAIELRKDNRLLSTARADEETETEKRKRSHQDRKWDFSQ